MSAERLLRILITHIPPDPSTPNSPDPWENVHCRCKTGCTTMSCPCRKEGASCSPACGCAHGHPHMACRSPFSRLPQIFEANPERFTAYGFSPSWRVTRANPCFRKFLNPEPKKERQLDIDSLKTKIMADCEAWRVDRWPKGWRAILLDDKTDEQEKKKVWTSIMEYVPGHQHENSGKTHVMMTDPDSHTWSFCRDRWVLRSKCHHCIGCDICYDDAFHCRECRTCKVGRWFECNGCGGFSFTGARYGVVKGRLAQDAHTVQRGLSMGRPKKRAREVEHRGFSLTSSLTSEVRLSRNLSIFDNADIGVKQTVPEAPDDIATRLCNCKDQCISRRCPCRRWGGECKDDCKCQDCDSCCVNVFTVNSYFFGPSLPGSAIPRATPCFTDYVESKTKYDPRDPFCRERRDDTSVEKLENLLLAREDFFETSNELRDWHQTLDTLAINSEERKKHLWWLFRKGLSNEADIGFFYSFRKTEWIKEEDFRHCAVCNKCYSVHESWHCGVCKQCRHGGLDEPCRQCGGTSSMAKPRSEDDFGDLESEPSRSRISAPMHGETLQTPGSQHDAQVVNRPSVTASPFGEPAITIDETRTPCTGGALSPPRPPIHEELRSTNAQSITQDTNRLPIVQGRAVSPGGGSAAHVAPARLTTSNLEQHMHLNSHNLSNVRHEASSQPSGDYDAIERFNADFVHRTFEDRCDRGCECVDDCRSSECPCATSDTLCSMNCRCNIDTTNDERWGGCFNHLRRFNDLLLRQHYFGIARFRMVHFHSCFASRVLAFLSGDLSVASIKGGPQWPSHRLISRTEMGLIEKLPDVPLEGDFVEWIRQSPSLDSHSRKRWLFGLALGEGCDVQDLWKFSFCEKEWVCTRVWMHCAPCRRCHQIAAAKEWCHD